MDRWREWARLSEGCYVLRSNVTDWNSEELWARLHATPPRPRPAFRIHKTDRNCGHFSGIRDRNAVEAAHPGVLSGVCVVEDAGATLPARRVGQRNLGKYSRSAEITLVDVVLPTRNGVTIRKRYVSRPTEQQAVLFATPESALPQLARNGPSVVKTRPCPHWKTQYLSPKLAELELRQR